MLQEIAFFLVAVGLESLIKSMLVAADPKIIENKKTFYHHRLPDFARRAGLSCDDEEMQLLGKLQGLLEWAARYPIPPWHSERSRKKSDADVVAEQDRFVVNSSSLPGALGDDDWPIALALVERTSRTCRSRLSLGQGDSPAQE